MSEPVRPAGQPARPEEVEVTNMLSLTKISAILALAITITATAVYVATFSHGTGSGLPYILFGVFAALLATVVPIWLESWITNGATYQLAVVGWRLGTMLMALTLTSLFLPPGRNYAITTLLACYFVTLPLESVLLARRARR